jgi:tripartite-type tricarboxylate transporter receptor subunit TctC
MAGVDLVHVPYKGTGPLITDMLGGQIGLTIASAVPLSPQVRSGKLRGLGVTGPRARRVSRGARHCRDRSGL